ncbi:unnamed protein product [Protopolystoma xenopodis]|uniref:Uncharacterized protein n=1 Tax=Protopolystoma xenopodis TaxID=117903 RepID=A0A3S5A651_9PLAT|nr:unnamed protein product [Protopolystoma xenopodis]
MHGPRGPNVASEARHLSPRLRVSASSAILATVAVAVAVAVRESRCKADFGRGERGSGLCQCQPPQANGIEEVEEALTKDKVFMNGKSGKEDDEMGKKANVNRPDCCQPEAERAEEKESVYERGTGSTAHRNGRCLCSAK